jgi:hypothetical protein
LIWLSGGRTWWAHFEFTRINIEPIILRKKIEELREPGASAYVRSTSGIVRRRGLVRVTLGCPPAHRTVATRAPHRAGRHPVDAREHARHVTLVAESGGVRCLAPLNRENVVAGVDLRAAVTTLQSELAVVELLKRFGGLLAHGIASHILDRQCAGSHDRYHVLSMFGLAENPLAEVAEWQTR